VWTVLWTTEQNLTNLLVLNTVLGWAKARAFGEVSVMDQTECLVACVANFKVTGKHYWLPPIKQIQNITLVMRPYHLSGKQVATPSVMPTCIERISDSATEFTCDEHSHDYLQIRMRTHNPFFARRTTSAVSVIFRRGVQVGMLLGLVE
jgi:hypothetical protein